MSSGYYSYLALSQSNWCVKSRRYEIDCEIIIHTCYFSSDFPEQIVNNIRNDFYSSFYLCRTPFHSVGSGIPFNSGIL